MDVEGRVVVFRKVGVDGACVGLVGASTATADGFFTGIFRRKGPD